MIEKIQFEKILETIVKTIDISDELFDSAEKMYVRLGSWIDEKTPNYKINIYPQGSFGLGTVTKPLSNRDTYDLDLVCEFEERYNLTAKELKIDIVKPLLIKYDLVAKIEEKRRCWHVEYENIKNFHMDIIPAIRNNSFIEITDRIEDINSYDYIGSNPKGYIEWFDSRKAVRKKALYESYCAVLEHAEIEPIKEYKIKTPLQKAIQLLKRHRDIMFLDDTTNCKPISIIITTIAAQLYENEESILESLNTILEGAESFINSQKKGDEFYIKNPSYTGLISENFADKWNEYPERAKAFYDWLSSAKKIFLYRNISCLSEKDLLNIYGLSFGDEILKKAFKMDNSALEYMQFLSDEQCTSIIPYKEKCVLEAPHRQVLDLGKSPQKSRVIIVAEATLPSGLKIALKNDGKELDKGTTIEFRAIWGGKSTGCLVRWQIVNLGVHVPEGQLRGGFESDKIGISIDEHCAFTGHHGVQCFITLGKKILYKSNIFIVNIK